MEIDSGKHKERRERKINYTGYEIRERNEETII
jgi:hypothetical protein